MPRTFILLVEDDENQVALFERAMRRSGLPIDVEVIMDGQAALDYFARPEATPLVILLDLKLPLVDGFQVLQRIRTQPQTNRIPVVILSSSDEQRDIIRGYRLGANSYVVKPMEPQAFTETMQRLVRYWTELNVTT